MEGGETWRVFIDNKRWDALVSAWPTELDDRHAVYSHVTALLIRAPHERAHRATGRKDERQKRRCKESGSWGSGGLREARSSQCPLSTVYKHAFFTLSGDVHLSRFSGADLN